MQMVDHLEATLCPPGTRIWPVQSQSWLEAHIDCGESGSFNVSNSKTDYLVIMQRGWEHLNSLSSRGIQITGTHLAEVLQYVVAFYEVGLMSMSCNRFS